MPVKSRKTHGSVPMVQASWPGGMWKASPRPASPSVPSSNRTPHAAAQHVAGVRRLAGVGAGERLRVLGPAPARLDDATADDHAADGDQIHLAPGRERPRLLR